MPPLSQHTRVCAYDRAGLGWSDFVRRPFDRNANASNLHTLLHNASIPAPYILVGHSIGGVYIRAYTQHYPREVVGLIFVDSAHENQTARRLGDRSPAAGTLNQLLRLCEAIAPTGIFRLFGLGSALMEDTGLSPSVRQAAASTLHRTTYCRTIANELNTSDLDTSLPTPPAGLGNLPLIVLAAGQDITPLLNASPSASSTPAPLRFGSRWLRLQQELASLSTQGRLTIIENSGHYIHLDQPERGIQAILDVLAITRNNEK